MAISAKYACDVLSSQIPLTPNYDDGKTAYISAYGVFDAKNGKKVIVRAADHGTYLFHWADRNEGVDLSQSANYAITFKDCVEITHKTGIRGVSPPVFVVRQYVYTCKLLEDRDILAIVEAIRKLIDDGVYTDPFIGTSKHAVIWREETNRAPVDITTKVARQKRRRERKQMDRGPQKAPDK